MKPMAPMSGLVPSEELWYEDGNVILIAGSRGFRVHRGILAQRSPVFRDLFTVPQPSYALLMDGCAVVHLPDDPLHLECLLSAMYDRSFFNGADSLRHISEVASGIICLSHKYDVQPFYEEAIYRLLEDYPSTFDAFDALPHFQINPFNAVHHAGMIFIINAARHIATPELLEMLPLAFYFCSQLDASLLVNGIERSDGRVEKLCTEDLCRCVNGKEDLMKANAAATNCLGPSVGNLNDEECATLDRCEMALITIAKDALEADIFAACDVLTNINSWINEAAKTHGLCEFCHRHIIKAHREARKDIWDHLDELFELRKESSD